MKIPLIEWANRNYSPAPSPRIVRAWAASGQLLPAPEKVGKTWMIDEKAVRIPLAQVSVDVSKLSNRAANIFKTA